MNIIYKTPIKETPCKQACPAGIAIPRYIRLIREGKFAEALAVVHERVPFPGVLGHVCPHFCEEKCERGRVDEPVAINALKRFVSENDTGFLKQRYKVLPATGKRVAIIGSGPTGLTAAYYLTKLGHSVTVFEALPVIGGMMRVGIPEYRLPREVLDKEIKEIKSIGFEIKTDTRVDSLDKLLGEGYDAVLLAIGAHRGIRLMVEGEDNPGLIDGVTFLRDVSLGKETNLGDRVAVIGGGNVAIDSARTALRLGCREVNIIYHRTMAEIPAMQEEVKAALYEGVKMILLTAPERISRKNSKLSLRCIRIELGEPDASARPRPVPIKDSGFFIDFDSIIVAIGQATDIPRQFNLEKGKGNVIQVDPDTLATVKKGVFAAGDAVTGTASVVEAIAAGRRSAMSIDKYLGGDGIIEETREVSKDTSTWLGFEESILDKNRNSLPLLEKDKRLASSGEVELGFTKGVAIEEASRCMACDQQVLVSIHPDRCTKCYRCQMICSLIYQRAFNPEKARIVINLPEIVWTGECIGGCTLCIKRCLDKAIVLE